MADKIRMQTICSLVDATDTIADIGADHGKIALYIAKNNLCKNLIVNDISNKSLQKAINRFKDLHIGDNLNKLPNIKFVVCCGSELAKNVDTVVDCAIIAGMGGKEILKIIAGLRPKTAIVSPQKNADITKLELEKLGYTTEKDLEIIDDKRKYYIFKVVLKQV